MRLTEAINRLDEKPSDIHALGESLASKASRIGDAGEIYKAGKGDKAFLNKSMGRAIKEAEGVIAEIKKWLKSQK